MVATGLAVSSSSGLLVVAMMPGSGVVLMSLHLFVALESTITATLPVLNFTQRPLGAARSLTHLSRERLLPQVTLVILLATIARHIVVLSVLIEHPDLGPWLMPTFLSLDGEVHVFSVSSSIKLSKLL